MPGWVHGRGRTAQWCPRAVRPRSGRLPRRGTRCARPRHRARLRSAACGRSHALGHTPGRVAGRAGSGCGLPGAVWQAAAVRRGRSASAALRAAAVPWCAAAAPGPAAPGPRPARAGRARGACAAPPGSPGRCPPPRPAPEVCPARCSRPPPEAASFRTVLLGHAIPCVCVYVCVYVCGPRRVPLRGAPGAVGAWVRGCAGAWVRWIQRGPTTSPRSYVQSFPLRWRLRHPSGVRRCRRCLVRVSGLG
jgi:hypothetical protein